MDQEISSPHEAVQLDSDVPPLRVFSRHQREQ